MPRFVENIESKAEARKKIGKAGAKILIDENGKLYKWDSTTTATDDDGKTTLKPTVLATANPVLPGAWVNTSRATRYYNKGGEIMNPVKEFFDVFTPTKATDFEIDISAAGFTVDPVNYQVTAARTNGQTATNAPKANVKSVTKTKIILDVVEPNTASIEVLGIKVGTTIPLINASITTLAATVLSVRVIGI